MNTIFLNYGCGWECGQSFIMTSNIPGMQYDPSQRWDGQQGALPCGMKSLHLFPQRIWNERFIWLCFQGFCFELVLGTPLSNDDGFFPKCVDAKIKLLYLRMGSYLLLPYCKNWLLSLTAPMFCIFGKIFEMPDKN